MRALLAACAAALALAAPARAEIGMIDGAYGPVDSNTVTFSTAPAGWSDPTHGHTTWQWLRDWFPSTRIVAVQAVTNSDDPLRDEQIGAAVDILGRRGVPVVALPMGRYMSESPATCQALRRWPDTTFVVGAGNGGTNNDVVPFYPASCRYVPNVVRAGSLGPDGQRAPFSNYGERGTYRWAGSDSTSWATRIITVWEMNEWRDR